MTSNRSILARVGTVLAHELRAQRAFYGAWLIWFAAFTLLVRSTLGGPDGNRYMAYVRSIVFDHDLLLMNELEHFGQHVIVTATGYSAQIANVGVIPFWLPFYLMGVLAHMIGGVLGSGLGSDYALWLDFGDWFYGLLALMVIYRWARTRFTKRISFAATMLIALGSSFYYYMTALAPSYHTISALLCAVYLYLWDATRKSRSAWQWLALGLLLGSMASIAQYQILLGVFLLFDVRLALAGPMLGRREVHIDVQAIKNLLTALLVIPGVLLPLVPQLIAWGIIFGNPFFNPYTAEADWSGSHFVDIFVSPYHGLLFTAPILIIAVAGWLAALRSDQAIAIGSLAALAGIAYTSATRIGWWEGVSFGGRYFIVLTPVFVVGLAYLLTQGVALKRLGQPVTAFLLSLCAVCALWTFGYYLQAATGLTSFSEYHPAAQWVANQFALLRNPIGPLATYWLAERSAPLQANLIGFALYSLVLGRVAAGWISSVFIATRRRWIVALALVPIGFALLLLSTIAPGEQHKQELAASLYYQNNLARGQLDYEQFSNEYVESAHYHEALGQQDAVQHDIQRALALWPGALRLVVTDTEVAGYRPLHLVFGEQVDLLGYQIVGDNAPAGNASSAPCAAPPATCVVTVRLLWRAGARLPVDYDTAVILLDTSGVEVGRTPPPRGLEPFPMSWWPAGMLFSDDHIIDITSTGGPALLHARVQVFDGTANKRLPVRGVDGTTQDGTIGELKRSPLAISAVMPARATLSDSISLVDSSGIQWSNGSAEVSLVWRDEKSIAVDYTVFLHLLDAQNHIIAQSDAPPRNGSYPTHAWSPGESVIDVHRINLDRKALQSVSRMEVGMYTPADGRRLPVSTGGDAIILSPSSSENR